MIFNNDIKYEVDISNIFHNTPWSVSVNVSFMSWRSINCGKSKNFPYHNAEFVSTAITKIYDCHEYVWIWNSMDGGRLLSFLSGFLFFRVPYFKRKSWLEIWYEVILHIKKTNFLIYSITSSSSYDMCVFVCLDSQTYQNPCACYGLR